MGGSLLPILGAWVGAGVVVKGAEVDVVIDIDVVEDIVELDIVEPDIVELDIVELDIVVSSSPLPSISSWAEIKKYW